MRALLVGVVVSLSMACEPVSGGPDGGEADSGMYVPELPECTCSQNLIITRQTKTCVEAGGPAMGLPEFSVVGDAITFGIQSRLPSCADVTRTATVTVVDAAGDTVQVSVMNTATTFGHSNVDATFTPTRLGKYEVTAVFEPGLGTVTGSVLVIGDKRQQPKFEDAYADDMSSCEVVFRTLNGAVLCQRAATVSVYRAGQLETQFAGVELAVTGNGVWTSVGSTVEHRTDNGAALSVDATIPAVFAPVVGSSSEREYTHAVTNGVLSVRLENDGGTTTNTLAPLDLGANGGVLATNGVNASSAFGFMSAQLCEFSPACSDTLCGCAAQGQWVLAGGDGLWTATTRSVVRHYPRPYSFTNYVEVPLLSSLVAPYVHDASAAVIAARAVAFPLTPARVIVPLISAGSSTFFLYEVPDAGFVISNSNFLAFKKGAHTLVFVTR